jgi:hypothetical protein
METSFTLAVDNTLVKAIKKTYSTHGVLRVFANPSDLVPEYIIRSIKGTKNLFKINNKTVQL